MTNRITRKGSRKISLKKHYLENFDDFNPVESEKIEKKILELLPEHLLDVFTLIQWFIQGFFLKSRNED